MSGTICVLATDSLVSRALISSLAREFSLAAVIVEEGGSLARLRRTLRYRLKRLGATTFVSQILFGVYDKLWIGRTSRTKIHTILRPFGDVPEDLPWHIVPSINSPEALALIQEHAPNVCVVSGTSIIRSSTLQELPPLINLHCGITPAYRGVHGGFWAVHQNDAANLGVTIHKIDQGVDTGAIIAQAPVSINPDQDNHRTIVAKQYAVGIPLLINAIHEALDGHLTTTARDDLPTQQWFSPTFGDYRRFRHNMRMMRRPSDEATQPPDNRGNQ